MEARDPGRHGGRNGCGSFDAVLAHHKVFGFVAGGKAADNRLWPEDAEVREAGDVAVATADWLFDRDLAGPTPARRGPATFVLVRRPDGRRIIHAHFADDPPPRLRP